MKSWSNHGKVPHGPDICRRLDATHVTCASALNHVTLIETCIASWEMERCSRFSAFAVGIFMRQDSRDISDMICCVPNVFLRLGKENLLRKVMKRPLKTLHSVKITVGSSNFWAWSWFPGGMGPSDFGLGTELLDGIDEEDLGTLMDFDGLPFGARQLRLSKIIDCWRQRKALNKYIITRIPPHLLFNCWTVIFPKCPEPNPWNREARSSSASRPPSATTVAWDSFGYTCGSKGRDSRHEQAQLVAYYCYFTTTSLKSNFNWTICTTTWRFKWIQCRVYVFLHGLRMLF